jgi:spore germination cell wall hydrolase CwlJ-like protein
MMNEIILAVALTLWGECRGEPLYEKRLVASTFWNRADGIPKNIPAIVFHARQYSCWNDIASFDWPDKACRSWQECLDIAAEIANGSFVPVSNATHYHVATMEKRPWWASSMEIVKQTRAHIYYTERKTACLSQR